MEQNVAQLNKFHKTDQIYQILHFEMCRQISVDKTKMKHIFTLFLLNYA